MGLDLFIIQLLKGTGGTVFYLKILQKKELNTCSQHIFSFCKKKSKTIDHFFSHCNYVEVCVDL